MRMHSTRGRDAILWLSCACLSFLPEISSELADWRVWATMWRELEVLPNTYLHQKA